MSQDPNKCTTFDLPNMPLPLKSFHSHGLLVKVWGWW